VVRTTCLILIILFTGIALQAQNDTNIQNWQSEDDFRNAESAVLEKIVWLEENPMSTASNDTKSISEYIITWLSNVPYMSVTFDEVFLEGFSNTKKYKFGEKFRVTYLFGKSYFILTHPDEDNEAAASSRGIEGMVKVYQELKKVDPSVKHRILEKYSRMVKSNKIETYTQTQLAKAQAESF